MTVKHTGNNASDTVFVWIGLGATKLTQVSDEWTQVPAAVMVLATFCD